MPEREDLPECCIVSLTSLTHAHTRTQLQLDVVSMQLDSGDRQQGAGTKHVLLVVQPGPMSQELLNCCPVIQQLPVPQTT